MYNKVESNMNFVDREKQTEKFWEDNDIFKKSMEQRSRALTGRPRAGMTSTTWVLTPSSVTAGVAFSSLEYR